MSDLATDLPPDLTIGVSTSAWQVEGSSATRGRCIWDDLATVPGAIADGATADPACDQVARIGQDADLMAWLGVDAYRFSISWPRVQPGGSGPISADGLAHYDRLCDLLLERGITPLATLYHWDLPSELQALGGWLDPATADRFGEYAQAMAERLGDRVGTWATLNEPWCSAFLGYASGEHAPGRTDPAQALEVAYRLLVAHARAVHGLRAGGAGPVGIVLNLIPAVPDDPYREDPDVLRAARHIDGQQNRLWLDALAGHGLPEDVLAGTSALTDWGFVDDAALQDVATPLDWLGVNYYTVLRLAPAEPGGAALAGSPSPVPGCPPVRLVPRGPLTTMGWEIHPPGLGAALRMAAEALAGVPLWVTENGIALPDRVGGAIDDPARVAYLADHLEQVLAARADGLDVRGYLVWSLLDNIEWAHGWTQRFGLVHVDPATQVRTPRASARWLRDLLSRRR